MLTKPRHLDVFFLTVFTALITYTPYYLFGILNIFELGIYLPGISAVLDGQIPFRDFFYLRGPFELYLPAAIMRIFGEDVGVLASWFYFGTVLTLVLYVFIAKRVLQTRFLLYLFVPVLVARTFPRVVYTFWGGMRFALGALVVLLLIDYLRLRKTSRIVLAGVFTGIAFLTSIDVGFCALVAGVGTFTILLISQMKYERPFVFQKSFLKAFLLYGLAFLLTVGSYLIYLMANGAFGPYWESVWTVSSQMTTVFDVQHGKDIPQNIVSFIIALLNPGGDYFKYLTPAYCFLFMAIYFFVKYKRDDLEKQMFLMVPIFFYGLSLYVLAFRNIQAAQFEMALQPEKLLFFILLERVFFYFQDYKKRFPQAKIKKFVMNFLILGLIMSSLGYSVARYNRRFFAFQYIKAKITGKNTDDLNPLSEESSEALTFARAGGAVVPSWQAEDIRHIRDVILSQTLDNEPVAAFGELGMVHFLLDRPAVGRFSMGIFSWLDDNWHNQWMLDLENEKPKFILHHKELPKWFEAIYFQVPANKMKYQRELDFLAKYYQKVDETPSLKIYKLLK